MRERSWRINHLYKIKNKEGNQITFRKNWAQEELFNCNHPNKIILKARQLGITTYFCIDLLDRILWEENLQCGIIAHTLSDAQSIFVDKLKFTFDHIHPSLHPLYQTIGDSAKELRFKHGSTIRVGTSLRSSTLNYLHISELGKISVKYPEKAREIKTGALQTLAPGQHCYIESTAEGATGLFYDMCQEALDKKNRGAKLGVMDFKFFFFPWWKEPVYQLEQSVLMPAKLHDYFEKLEKEENITLTDFQKAWYVKKSEVLKDDMMREYPSTPREAFEVSQEGFWYSNQIRELYKSNHVINLPHDKTQLVHTAWDLGQADATAIWFFQINPAGTPCIIDFFKKSNMPLSQIKSMLDQKGYNYGTHIWPHDAKHRDKAGVTFEQQASDLGLVGVVLEIHSILHGINLVRDKIPSFYFDRDNCKEGLLDLENYKKRWNNILGGYESKEVHDEASHAAAAMRYLCAGIGKISTHSLEEDMEALRNYWGGGNTAGNNLFGMR